MRWFLMQEPDIKWKPLFAESEDGKHQFIMPPLPYWNITHEDNKIVVSGNFYAFRWKIGGNKEREE